VADREVVIVVGEWEVTSVVEVESAAGETRVWVTSSCADMTSRNQVVLAANATYPVEQFEFDLEQARFRFASELAGQVNAAAIAAAGIVETEIPARLTSPSVARPGASE
jgi:hypothetical protein